MNKREPKQHIEKIINNILGSLRIEGIELTQQEQTWLFDIAVKIYMKKITTEKVVKQLIEQYTQKE